MALSISGAGSLLVRIPTALFPIALGLAGLGALAIAASDRVEIDSLIPVGQVLLGLAGGMLLIDLALYLVKLLRHREEVAEDISMATRANLLAPGLMAAMVLGGASAPTWAGGALGLDDRVHWPSIAIVQFCWALAHA
ncbi:MAG: hypothetical protein JJ931_06095 [Henriciella sp.]|nr:hypothetical protein [Henriciella sp.]MBO6694969.1 hypothetical protein [Henriciella sp.]